MSKKSEQRKTLKNQIASEEPTLKQKQEIADAQVRFLHLIVKHVLRKSSDEAVNLDRVGDS